MTSPGLMTSIGHAANICLATSFGHVTSLGLVKSSLRFVT